MKRLFLAQLVAITCLFLSVPGVKAQQSDQDVYPSSAVSMPIAPMVKAAPRSPVSPSADKAAFEGGCPPQSRKICVSEPKLNTIKVYGCKCEEYCLPRCSFLSLLSGQCDCDDGRCGILAVRHRLVVKKVADCDTKQCVPREMPVDCSATRAAPPCCDQIIGHNKR